MTSREKQKSSRLRGLLFARIVFASLAATLLNQGLLKVKRTGKSVWESTSRK